MDEQKPAHTEIRESNPSLNSAIPKTPKVAPTKNAPVDQTVSTGDDSQNKITPITVLLVFLILIFGLGITFVGFNMLRSQTSGVEQGQLCGGVGVGAVECPAGFNCVLESEDVDANGYCESVLEVNAVEEYINKIF